MRIVAIIGFMLLAGLALPNPPVHAQPDEAPMGMGAVEILDGLTSPNRAERDRAKEELALMSVDIATQLGKQVQLAGVREAQTALKAVGYSDAGLAVTTAAVALDSEEDDVRIAALEALIALSPKQTRAQDEKLFPTRRLNAIRDIVTDSEFLVQLCESTESGDKGGLATPVVRATRVMTLFDRLYGVGAMPLLLNGFAKLMLGEEPGAEKKSSTERDQQERERRSASEWFKAIWIADPAIYFNFNANAPWKDRKASVHRIDARLRKLKEEEIKHRIQGKDDVEYTGMRYGDYLQDLHSSGEVLGEKTAAFLRLQWWSGEKIAIDGEGNAQAVEDFNNLDRRKKREVRRAIFGWWYAYRAETEAS